MSGSEDEIYSTMFSSLKHPARRRILRMLSEKPMTFSEMLEELDVSSSHLTYHLESLGELLSKMKDGKYKLSSFGEAAVATMKGVEESPSSSRRRVLSFQWKSFLGLLVIAIILLSVVSAIQFDSLNQMSKEQQLLQNNLDEANAKNSQLLSLGVGSNDAIIFMRNVAQIDLTKYRLSLLSDTVQYRSDLGGVLEEVMKYALSSNDSQMDVVLRFRNNHFSKYQLYIDEGSPIYAQIQSSDIISATKDIVERYKTYSGDAYLQDMSRLMVNVQSIDDNGTTLNQTRLDVSTTGMSSQAFLMYTEDGVDFLGKSLWIVLDGGIVTQITDGWFLLAAGSTTVNISEEQAIEVAKEYVTGRSWNFNGTEVSNVTILESPVSAQFVPHPKDQHLTLFPYWYVTLTLAQTYPGDVNRIAVGVWADSGQIDTAEILNG